MYTAVVHHRGADSAKLLKLECVYAWKGLVLPRVSHSAEIALAGSRHLRSTFVAAPVLFAHAVVAVGKNLVVSAPLAHSSHVYHSHDITGARAWYAGLQSRRK